MKTQETTTTALSHEDAALERLKSRGKPKRRKLKKGETIPVPGYEFIGVRIAGDGIEVLEFDDGQISPIIPNPLGLARAVFSLVVLNSSDPFTHLHLRFIRRQLNMTQQKLAESIGVRRQTVVDYEKNERILDKAVELAVRHIALPTALNYLPAEMRKELAEPLQAIQNLYSHLDELTVSVDSIRDALKDAGQFRVKLEKEKPCCL